MVLAHVAGWEPHNLHDFQHMLPVFDLCYTDPAQPLAKAGEELLVDDCYHLDDCRDLDDCYDLDDLNDLDALSDTFRVQDFDPKKRGKHSRLYCTVIKYYRG